MNAKLTAQTTALFICGQINVDLKAGIVPSTVRTFAELHDYVDANEYAINVLEAAEVEHDPASQDQADMFNEAFEIVSVWLNRRYHRTYGTTPKPGRHS